MTMMLVATLHVAQGRSGDAKSLRDLPGDSVHPQRMRLSYDARPGINLLDWWGWLVGWMVGELVSCWVGCFVCVDLGRVI